MTSLAATVVAWGPLVFCWWDVADLSVEASVVVPIDVLGHCDLDVVDAAPGTAVADQVGLEQGVERLSARVVIRIALGADRGHRPGVGEPLGVAHRQGLHAPVAVMDQLEPGPHRAAPEP